MTTREKVDVVIAGAGAASSVYAALLAEAGKSVVVLETGPARQLTDLYSSQIWARRLKWARPHMIEAGEGRLWINVNAGLGFGGAAMHHCLKPGRQKLGKPAKLAQSKERDQERQ